jgi:hypothetical protein
MVVAALAAMVENEQEAVVVEAWVQPLTADCPWGANMGRQAYQVAERYHGR